MGRLELHTLLKGIPSVKDAYYQPPENLKLEFPCILYRKDSENTRYANNDKYLNKNRYLITIIDRSPESSIPEGLKIFPYCSFNRQYTKDNLNHYVYTLYF